VIRRHLAFTFESSPAGVRPSVRNPCCAVVCDEGGMIIGMVRRPEETLAQLLDRVEAALPDALETGFIDELTPAMQPRKTRRRRTSR